VVIDDATGIEPTHDGFGAQGLFGVAQGPGVARLAHAIDKVGVHVVMIPGGVVAHGVHHHRRMVVCGADIIGSVTGISIGGVGACARPVVVAEMRLRERDQHADIVRCPEDLLETQVGARLAAVVVGVDAVDPEALESFEALAGGPISGQGGADLGIVQGQGGEEKSGAVEIEVPALDPELAEAEPHRPGRVEYVVVGIEKRALEGEGVVWCVDVP